MSSCVHILRILCKVFHSQKQKEGEVYRRHPRRRATMTYENQEEPYIKIKLLTEISDEEAEFVAILHASLETRGKRGKHK